MKNIGFGLKLIRQIICCVVCMLLIILCGYEFIDMNTIKLFKLYRDRPICDPIALLIIYTIFLPWIRLILIFIYVILLWNAKLRFATINKCLR